MLPIIEVKNLSKCFATKQVLQNINFSINKSQSVAIIGASGCGKSVLIKNMVGLLQPSSGQILFNNTNIANLNQKQRLKLGLSMGMLFQHSALFDSLNVLQNIVFPITVHKSVSKQQQIEIATKNLKAVDLDESILYSLPSSLSGGMKKRVALARLLTQNPNIMFFDEPTTGLDPVTSVTITKLIKQVTTNLNATSITISHDINSVCMLADKIIMLHKGTAYWQGNAQQLMAEQDPIVKTFVNGQ